MSGEKHRILFVDDEPRVMYGLRYMLHTMSNEWDMNFVTGSRQALAAMQKHPYDLIVADMLMPEMYGGDLLEEVRRKHPGTVRFILSGYSNKEMIIRSFGATHQYLAKPCNAEILQAMVEQIIYLHKLLPAEGLRRMVLDMKTLSTLPENERALADALASKDTSMESLSAMIGQDPAMTAIILHFVNSAFFGLRHKIESIDHAVSTLGVETVRDMFEEGQVLMAFPPGQAATFGLKDLYDHSVKVSARAGRIMRTMTESANRVNEAIMAGMLHAIGVPVLIANHKEYGAVIETHRTKGLPLSKAEREGVGADHAQIGGYLLGIWGLPDAIVEAVLHHLEPGKCPNATPSPLTAVHAANAIEWEKRLGADDPRAPKLDADYLGKLGVEKLVPQWKADASEQALTGATGS